MPVLANRTSGFQAQFHCVACRPDATSPLVSSAVTWRALPALSGTVSTRNALPSQLWRRVLTPVFLCGTTVVSSSATFRTDEGRGSRHGDGGSPQKGVRKSRSRNRVGCVVWHRDADSLTCACHLTAGTGGFPNAPNRCARPSACWCTGGEGGAESRRRVKLVGGGTQRSGRGSESCPSSAETAGLRNHFPREAEAVAG